MKHILLFTVALCLFLTNVARAENQRVSDDKQALFTFLNAVTLASKQDPRLVCELKTSYKDLLGQLTKTFQYVESVSASVDERDKGKARGSLAAMEETAKKFPCLITDN